MLPVQWHELCPSLSCEPMDIIFFPNFMLKSDLQLNVVMEYYFM